MYAIELDVYQCKTREIIVFHDLKVNRTTNGKGYIEGKTFNEIINLDAGNCQLIPTLEDVLDLIDNKCIVNIELKGENTANKVADISCYYIRHHKWNINNFLISSFNHVELEIFKKLSLIFQLVFLLKPYLLIILTLFLVLMLIMLI